VFKIFKGDKEDFRAGKTERKLISCIFLQSTHFYNGRFYRNPTCLNVYGFLCKNL